MGTKLMAAPAGAVIDEAIGRRCAAKQVEILGNWPFIAAAGSPPRDRVLRHFAYDEGIATAAQQGKAIGQQYEVYPSAGRPRRSSEDCRRLWTTCRISRIFSGSEPSTLLPHPEAISARPPEEPRASPCRRVVETTWVRCGPILRHKGLLVATRVVAIPLRRLLAGR